MPGAKELLADLPGAVEKRPGLVITLQTLADHSERVQAGGGAGACRAIVPLGELKRLSGSRFRLVVFSFRAIELGEVGPGAAGGRFQQRQGGRLKRLGLRRAART